MSVHPVARAFDGAADDYERARPSFPPEAVDHLRGELDLRPGRTVLDLAAGTGKLTRLLIPTGARVVAVEPLAGMRAVLEREVPEAEVHEGVAEAIPLPDGSVDAATVAQAFHWFDRGPAYRELHRVLRPGGKLAVVWNTRDDSDPLHSAIEQVVKPLRDVAAVRAWVREFDAAERPERFSYFELWTQRWAQEFDRDLLRARFRSVSFIAGMAPGEQRQVLDRIVAAADGLPERFDFPYVTEVFICRRQT